MILLLAGLSAAQATVCLVFEDSYHPQIFPSTQEALPPNVQPLVRGYGEEEILLLDEAGTQLPITVSPGPSFDGRSQREVTPLQPLAPGTYTLRSGESWSILNIEGPEDHAAPLGGRLLSWTWNGPMLSQGLMYFGHERNLMLELEEVVDTIPALVEVRWSRSPFGPWTTHSFWPNEVTFIGHDLCPPDSAIAPVPGTPMYLQTRSRDAAGQVSTWSSPERIVPGREPASPIEPTPALGLGFLVALIAIGALALTIRQARQSTDRRME